MLDLQRNRCAFGQITRPTQLKAGAAAEAEHFSKLGARAKGFETLFALVRERIISAAPLVLVETGCLRHADLNWLGDGCSSILFQTFAAQTKSCFITIDIDPGHCQVAREQCPGATVICGNSVRELHKLRSSVAKIDLLYLDSYDIDWNNPRPSALHHLNELCAASPMLVPGSIVFVDDNRGAVGKGMYIRQYMNQIGAHQIWDEYMIGFVMP